MVRRRMVYEAAKQARPQRWKGRATRDWQSVSEVWLNLEKSSLCEAQNLEHAA